MGLFISLQDDPELRAAMTARYVGSGSAGHAIDQGAWMIGFAIVLGILVHIARSVDKWPRTPATKSADDSAPNT
jgi:hypothetical protein